MPELRQTEGDCTSFKPVSNAWKPQVRAVRLPPPALLRGVRFQEKAFRFVALHCFIKLVLWSLPLGRSVLESALREDRKLELYQGTSCTCVFFLCKSPN